MRLTRLTDWLEAQDGLDGVAQPLNQAAHRAIRTGPLKDLLSGTWLGHPVHPALVSLPIGSWVSASVLDLVPGNGCRRAARRLVGLGVLAALPTASTGLSDWSDTSGAEQRIGLVHAALNTAAIGLYGASWWARRRPGRAGALLSLAGMAAVAGAGYLGGHLVYAQGVGVDTNAFHSGPQDWQPVTAVDDLPTEGAAAVTAGQARVLVVRQGKRLRALEDRCSHRGGPLSDGEIDGDCVTCPWHGSRFDLNTGEVRRGPATVAQPAYETRVQAGQVELRRREPRGLRTNPVGPG